ncbi:hypothetical protein HYZ70_00855 [Candidatus Curtissbacteria bacterium]|nr:hypothetical protein [Candidatus Curtissbacteria bacterium]
MRKELKDIFSILKNGTQEETKVAKQRIDKLWKSDSKNFKGHAKIALEQLEEFDRIQNPRNQEAFISGLSLFFLALSDTYFEELENFTLKVICHPNGHVREQVRKTADWLYGSLVSRIHPFVWPNGKKLTQRQITEQEIAKKEFAKYLSDIELLMEKYDDGSYDSVEYIDEIKPSVYKSLQLLWSDLTRGNLLKDLHTPPREILSKRKAIEKELTFFLKKIKGKYTLADIQDIIYNETETDDLHQIIRIFDTGSPYELENIMDILNDAWNYFPHKILDGLCPAEVLSQNQKTKIVN